MKHVFVETTWVVPYAAPEHRRVPAAQRLLERAAANEIALHLPSVCLTEGRLAILRRYTPRTEADAIRSFLKWGRANGKVTEVEDAATRRVIDMFTSRVDAELRDVGRKLEALRSARGVDVFPLNDAMLQRALELGAADLALEPYDQAVLAGVLGRANELTAAGEGPACFCALDGHLQPWDKEGRAKSVLTKLYDDAKVWVYGDFELARPVLPSGWGA